MSQVQIGHLRSLAVCCHLKALATLLRKLRNRVLMAPFENAESSYPIPQPFLGAKP